MVRPRARSRTRGAAKRPQQDQLDVAAKATETELADLTEQVNAVAVAAYKGGQISALSTLLDSGSPGLGDDRGYIPAPRRASVTAQPAPARVSGSGGGE
jgi:hypothetical protein